MHTIGVVAVENAIAFDLATPIEVFEWTRDARGQRPYRVIVCGPPSDAGPLHLAPGHSLDSLSEADTVIVPGSRTPARAQPPEILSALRAAHRRGARIASICVGAFTLAQAGLLDGRAATTHWQAAGLFRALFPTVELTPEHMFQHDGGIHTSAGAAAGLDLCLDLIRRDHGIRVSVDAARHAVMPLHRPGGQAPFMAIPNDTESGELHDLTMWLSDRLDEPITLTRMAAQANMSLRTLNRRFHTRFGCSPMEWLLSARVRRAQELLIGSDSPVEHVAQQAGFGSPASFRTHFKRAAGVSPRSYRKSFASP